MTAWLHAHVKVYETYKIEKYFYKYLKGKEESDPTYSYNHIQYFISKSIYKWPFVLSSNLISMREIFKLLSSDTILKNSLLFFKWKEETHPTKLGNF